MKVASLNHPPNPSPTVFPAQARSSVRLFFVGILALADLELLERMISAMGLKREAVHVCETTELASALALHSPEFVIRLEMPDTISAPRGDWAEVGTHAAPGAKHLTTWHPAHLSRTPAAKKEAWQDLQRVARALGTLA
jgi:hypothetical protein